MASKQGNVCHAAWSIKHLYASVLLLWLPLFLACIYLRQALQYISYFLQMMHACVHSTNPLHLTYDQPELTCTGSLLWSEPR